MTFINELIDYRNEHLWNEMQNQFKISIQNSTIDSYHCFAEEDNITIFINPNDLSPDSFTHELLHLYLRSKECYINGSLKNITSNNVAFPKILSNALLEHVSNCLEHIKILPMYLEMGYDRTKFIEDYDLYKTTRNEIEYFENFFRNNGEINLNLIDPYIGRVVSILADPNNNFNYEVELIRLKLIDAELFDVIQKMVKHWKEIKLVDRQLYDHNYNDVTYNFFENLEQWMLNNNLI